MKKTILITLILAFIILVAIFAGMFLYKNSTSYYRVGRFAIVNGKLAFEATKFTGQEVIVYDGKEYGKEYDKVYKPREIGGRLTFSAYKRVGAETNYYIIYGDEIIGDTVEYYGPYNPTEVNKKIAFDAYFGGTKSRYDGKSRIVYDGQIYGEGYNLAGGIVEIGGKLAYVVWKDSSNDEFIIYDGKEIGSGKNPTSINGKLAYVSGNKVYFDGEFIEGGYDRIPRVDEGKIIKEINGKPAFVVVRDEKIFIVYDGKEYFSVEKPEIHYYISEVNDKLAYSYSWTEMTKLNHFEHFEGYVGYNGQEYGKEYDSAQFPFEINGKLGYIAKNGGKEFIVIDGEVATDEYNDIAFVLEIDEELIYVAKKFIGYSVYTYP